MYQAFRHHYLQQHSHHGSTLTVHAGPLFGATVCLILLTAWAAFQMQARCGDCRAWPVRCRCTREQPRTDERS